MKKPTHAAHAPDLRRRQLWTSALAWDGILPLGVAGLTYGIKVWFPADDVKELFAVILLPMIAALLRSMIGAQQLRRFTGSAHWWRQIGLAAAICLLLVFEISCGIFTFADNIPLAMIWFPIAFYVAYLAVIAVTFMPAKSATSYGE